MFYNRITPDYFHYIATLFTAAKWPLLYFSIGGLVLFSLLGVVTNNTTPVLLIWLSVIILFAALQTLVCSAFIFFFQNLASKNEMNKDWIKFYRVIEWCETAVFVLLIPFPVSIFLYFAYSAIN